MTFYSNMPPLLAQSSYAPEPMGILAITGSGAKALLQGQLTINVDSLSPNHPQLAAQCNRQGKIISLFYLLLHNDRFLLWMPERLIPVTIAALKKYAVFYPVSLTEEAANNELLSLFLFPAHTLSDWKKNQIEANIPSIYPETSGQFLPHELSLPTLKAVSFEKGCYTGQEIIARIHYRGKVKSYLRQLSLKTAADLYYGQSLTEELGQEAILIDYFKQSDHYTVLVLLS